MAGLDHQEARLRRVGVVEDEVVRDALAEQRQPVRLRLRCVAPIDAVSSGMPA